jgi:hypothetical protein
VYGQRIGTVNEVVFLFRRADRHLDPLQEWLRTGPAPICSLLTRLETGGSAEALHMCVISTLHVILLTLKQAKVHSRRASVGHNHGQIEILFRQVGRLAR